MSGGQLLTYPARKPKSIRAGTGSALIFAPLPFARIFTAMMGRGDETTFVRAMVGDDASGGAAVFGAGIVLTFRVPPIAIAWNRLVRIGRAHWIVGLCVLPMVARGLYVRLLLNRILSSGYLSTPIVGGSPLLIVVHTAAVPVLLALVVRWLEDAPAESQAEERARLEWVFHA